MCVCEEGERIKACRHMPACRSPFNGVSRDGSAVQLPSRHPASQRLFSTQLLGLCVCCVRARMCEGGGLGGCSAKENLFFSILNPLDLAHRRGRTDQQANADEGREGRAAGPQAVRRDA